MLVFVLMPITFSHAYYDPSYPGSITNPLQVEIVPTPSQIYQQSLRDQAARLDQKYQEINQASILERQRRIEQELLDSKRELQQKQKLDEILHQSQIPYVTNSVPVKSNDQICKDEYGLNSIWNGTLNNKGGLVCDCNKGYQWNMFKTQCNLIPDKKIIPVGGGGGSTVKVITPQAEKTLEVNITKGDTKEITPSIAKVETVITETNTAPSVSEVKHKGLWAKIKGWLGF